MVVGRPQASTHEILIKSSIKSLYEISIVLHLNCNLHLSKSDLLPPLKMLNRLRQLQIICVKKHPLVRK